MVSHKINPSNIINLETNDSSLIYDINFLDILDDTYVIGSRNLLKMFKMNDGSFVSDLAVYGNGPDEFLNIGNIWTKDSVLYLFDANKRALLVYDATGKVIKKVRLDENLSEHGVYGISQVMPNANGSFTSVNMFTDHTTEHNPMYSHLDESMSFVYNIVGRERDDGGYTPDQMTIDTFTGNILAWEQLKDTLFSIDDQIISPLYTFDFKDNRFPVEKQAEPQMYLRYQSFIEGKNVPYVSFIKYYQTYKNYIFFTFASADESWFLGKLDRNNNQATTYKFVSNNDQYSLNPFIKVQGDRLITSLTDNYNEILNPALYIIPIDVL